MACRDPQHAYSPNYACRTGPRCRQSKGTGQMSQSFRISGGLIDRSSPMRFTFNGKRMEGYAGDTLASALLANGQKLVGAVSNITARAEFYLQDRRSPTRLSNCVQGPHKSQTPAPPLQSFLTGSAQPAKITEGRLNLT